MMQAKRVAAAVCILGLLLGTFIKLKGDVAAQDPTRIVTIIVPYTEYEWWLITWSDNQVLCQVLVDHEGLPTVDEVAQSCGQELANQWLTTPPCKSYTENNQVITQCYGLYLYMVGSQPKEREETVELPYPTIWVDLEGCTPTPPDNRCMVLPLLVLTGEEPLPNERILNIQGTFDGAAFFCEGEICKIPLSATPVEGILVEFWADSSYGDTSERFTAQVRVLDTGVSPQPGGEGWYVDVISSQWRGAPLESCAAIWEAFPPVGGTPIWLSTPERFELLGSDEPYFYLAGRLIVQGLVDASSCPSGGLQPNGYADACGLESARPLVMEWQNQFDNRIIEVAKETGVPAQLMKNLFAQESQFWPGVFRVPNEFGLGQLTAHGTDAIFLWNPEFYQQFCPLVLSQEACDAGYLGLSEQYQAILRGALALQAQADCPECPTGVDLANATHTVSLFANTLKASCSQVARTVFTATNAMAGTVSTYEDLWRFAVANYHAGPGCVSFAIFTAWQNTGQLSWESAKSFFTEPCQGVIPYVEAITR